MEFGAFDYIWLSLGIPVLIVIYIYGVWSRKKNLRIIFDQELVNQALSRVSLIKRHLLFSLFLICFALMVLALMQPKWGTKTTQIAERGIEVVIGIDVSKSMLANDLEPDRQTAAKRSISELLDLLAGNRVGLIEFANLPWVLAPLTTDITALKNFYLTEADAETFVHPGTEIGTAIDKAIGMFTPNTHIMKVLVLYSDGETHDEESNTLEAAQLAADNGIIIFTVCVGTNHGGFIPIRDPATGNIIDYKKDEEGNNIRTMPETEVLEQIADLTGGDFYFYSAQGEIAQNLFSRIDQLEKTEFGIAQRENLVERFQIFLIPVLIGMIFFILIPERKKKENQR